MVMPMDIAEATNRMDGTTIDAWGDPRLMLVVRKFKKNLEGFGGGRRSTKGGSPPRQNFGRHEMRLARRDGSEAAIIMIK